jgi:hypothetical protein
MQRELGVREAESFRADARKCGCFGGGVTDVERANASSGLAHGYSPGCELGLLGLTSEVGMVRNQRAATCASDHARLLDESEELVFREDLVEMLGSKLGIAVLKCQHVPN